METPAIDIQIPKVKVFEIYNGRECRVLYIICCYCGKKHIHGGGSLDGDLLLGSRLSHCKFKKEYILTM